MATYGKKKRFILPSLSILRDSDAGSKAKHKPPKKTESLTLMTSTFNHGSQGDYDQDDSIREMASMLLDDTSEEQIKPNPGRYLSQIPIAKTLPNLAHAHVDSHKSLPQLPKLVFNGDDAWAMRMAPVVTAAGDSNSTYFDRGSEGVRNVFPLTSAHAHSRKGSAPTIPRKSSKRKSARSKITYPKLQSGENRKQALKKSISPPKLLEPIAPQQSATNDINNKIQAMLAATKALKGSTEPRNSEASDVNAKVQAMLAVNKAMKGGADQALLQGPYLPTRKSRLMDNKVFSKVKTAINDRLQARNARKRDSARNDRLLDPSNSELQDWEATSALEIRLNEGENLKNPKVYSLTGSGIIHRKPVADDGKSLRSVKSSIKSRQSGEDSFLEASQSRSALTRTPTSFETKLGDKMSLDQSREFVRDLPKLHQCTPKKDLSRFQMPKQYRYGSDIDAILSSSPQAQSTPRLRLEPSFEKNGRKTLKNVPADFRSVFDFDPDNSYVGQSSDMNMDLDLDLGMDPAGKAVFNEDSLKRKSPQVILTADVKRSKKHPSPNKEELDSMALIVKDSLLDSPQELPFANTTARGALSTKDANGKVKTTNRVVQGKVAFAKQELTKTTASMPNIGAKGLKSAMRKPTPEKGSSHQYFSQNDITDGSMMELDELQWDETEYNIGMRKN